MVGFVICTLIICMTIGVCTVSCKYLDKRGDLSYSRYKEIMYKLNNIESILKKGHRGE